jgi:hypothetical protein
VLSSTVTPAPPRWRAPNRAQPAALRRVAPVSVWAALGGLGLAFQVYVVTRWVAGPYFRAVPAGPSRPPEWMRPTIVGWEIVSWPLLGACLYWFLLRPWRRERRIATDGLLCLVWLLLYFWEPLSNYFGNWFTYNSLAFNRGSWVADVPGWHSFAKPGAMVVEPFLWALPAYGYGLFMGTVLGCWAMRKVKAARPEIRPIGLIIFCWGFMILMDILLEGVLWMPQQLFATPGGLGQLFLGSHTNMFPVTEAVFWGGGWAAISCVRYFTDDQGLTVAERGINRLRIGSGRKTALRFLALLGLCQVLYVGVYTLPSAIFVGAHSASWPRSIGSKSYLNDHLCGVGTNRACTGI